MVRAFDWFVMPIANPDGYRYSRQVFPTGTNQRLSWCIAEQFLIGAIFLDIKVKLLLRKVNWNWRKNIRPADAKQCPLPKLGDTSPNGPGVDLNRFSKSPDKQ